MTMIITVDAVSITARAGWTRNVSLNDETFFIRGQHLQGFLGIRGECQ